MAIDYNAGCKARLHADITELQQATRRGELPRELRLVKIEALTEAYFAATGEVPDATACERLADLCLYEELTDDDEHKVSRNVYPILSDTQIARRQEGKHTRKDGLKGEVPLSAASTIGSDGRNHGKLTRRDRNTSENNFVNKEARSRNKDRRKKYVEFTKIQPVFTIKIR
jgi:hypothetical protein